MKHYYLIRGIPFYFTIKEIRILIRNTYTEDIEITNIFYIFVGGIIQHNYISVINEKRHNKIK